MEEETPLEGFEDTEEGPKPDAPTLDIVPVKKRVIRNPIPKLNPERILGPKGLLKLEDSFQDFKFHGEGHEKHDLELMMRRFEHWAHVLFPQRPFLDVMERISQLGKKREVQVNLNRIRLGMKTSFQSRMDPDEDNHNNSNEIPQESMDDVHDDEFQRLLQEAEAEDEARESTSQVSDQDEIIAIMNQAKNVPLANEVESNSVVKPGVHREDMISEELLRKYDSSSSSSSSDDEEERSQVSLSTICVAGKETKDDVERNNASNSNKKRHLSQSNEDSEEDEDRLVKRKKTGNVLESSDED